MEDIENKNQIFCHRFALFRQKEEDMINHRPMQAHLEDSALVAASLGGDIEAFGAIVERYQNLVSAVAYSGKQRMEPRAS